MLVRPVPDFTDAVLLRVTPDFGDAVLRSVRDAPDFVPPVNLSVTFLALFVTVFPALVIALVTLETVVLLLAMRFPPFVWATKEQLKPDEFVPVKHLGSCLLKEALTACWHVALEPRTTAHTLLFGPAEARSG